MSDKQESQVVQIMREEALRLAMGLTYEERKEMLLRLRKVIDNPKAQKLVKGDYNKKLIDK